MKKRLPAKPKLTLEERFVSAGFAAFFGAFAAVLFSLFYFRGVNVGAGIGLLGFLGWFAGGFALVGFLFGPAVADLIGSLIALAVSEDDGDEVAGIEIPTWIAVVSGLVIVAAFLLWLA